MCPRHTLLLAPNIVLFVRSALNTTHAWQFFFPSLFVQYVHDITFNKREIDKETELKSKFQNRDAITNLANDDGIGSIQFWYIQTTHTLSQNAHSYRVQIHLAHKCWCAHNFMLNT